ncbi:DinB family protein [Amaricoccus sp. W119]|uniref:DinB family protein n=1 Tax=Amaricoccus sp. W119 TaxID=3391833 RepID=UPI0039A7624A
MIEPGYVLTMAEYNAEMNRRVYGAAARLPDAERRADRGVFWASIHGTLSHVLWADEMWLSRFAGWGRPAGKHGGSDRHVEDFSDLRLRREAFDADLLGWARALRPEDLAGDLVWRSGLMEREMSTPRAICVIHLFNHQTHHRGQVHALLTRAGEDTGATDLPFIL